MKIKKLLLTSGLALTPLAGSLLAQNQQPNIVMFFMDDMGYGDISLTGATGYTTPAIDGLANEGMYFTHFYTSQAISTASRAGLMTGCYANRISVPGVFMLQPDVGLNPEEEIIPEVLKKKGYTSSLIGKWHLGCSEPFMPIAQGFDEYFGLPYSNDMWPVNYDGKPFDADSKHFLSKSPQLPLYEGTKEKGTKKVGEIKTLEEQAQLTTMYTKRAVEFIERNKKGPFFLYLAHAMPHVPLAVSDKFKGKSGVGLFGDVMMEIDWSVEQVMKALKDNGLDDNTLVIFTSDNGPWLKFGNHSGGTGSLRGGKQTSWEGGQRVPCIMRWKGVIPEGVVNPQLASTMDILPTLATITGAPLPKEKIDGVNILPLLKGETKESPRKHLFYFYAYIPLKPTNNLEAVRDDRFKLVFPHKHQTVEAMGKEGFPGKDGVGYLDDLTLYDLRVDPGEQYNVADLYPEKVAELSAVADDMRKDLGDALLRIPPTNVRPVGKIKQ